ncbi:hypothetical protein [Kitasatospora viridis]|uniref:HEAT repeat protein n=1 Tax=Kitasatospora viridis TaxID=281105 RepID=A0A561S9C2_9ACTN|nr:hypothetical protein [Kitasatospora viridis]TWF71468.1 hypothetical protein FHX73_1998 [Kitasatospora viridis]
MSATPPDEHEQRAAVRRADSPDWSVRAAAGRQLAAAERLDEVAEVLGRLLLDPLDTAVTQETAVALLARKDTAGLRLVLLARSRAVETWTADEISAELYGDPDWLTPDGADRMTRQLRDLAAQDDDAGVRDEARRVLARLGISR